MYKDLLTEEEFGLMEKFVPYGEHGIHTIINIKLFEVNSIETILNLH